jgi:membrane-bound lytic murein transglycosylase D
MIADVSSTVADNATMLLAPDAPPLRKVALRAGRRDSVESIARRYRVSVAQVAQWNNVGTGAKFAPGQGVVVYVAGKARKGAAPAASTRTASARGTHRTRVAATGGSKSGKPARGAPSHKHVVARN